MFRSISASGRTFSSRSAGKTPRRGPETAVRPGTFRREPRNPLPGWDGRAPLGIVEEHPHCRGHLDQNRRDAVILCARPARHAQGHFFLHGEREVTYMRPFFQEPEQDRRGDGIRDIADHPEFFPSGASPASPVLRKSCSIRRNRGSPAKTDRRTSAQRLSISTPMTACGRAVQDAPRSERPDPGRFPAQYSPGRTSTALDQTCGRRTRPSGNSG
ncbi:MAG: hypothetical protein MZV64_02815 [Ignavibacteriales bacterium]|nr:hypothetical protein [Ignavibacteriales bacterium]